MLRIVIAAVTGLLTAVNGANAETAVERGG
jgi:hypothetical protein